MEGTTHIRAQYLLGIASDQLLGLRSDPGGGANDRFMSDQSSSDPLFRLEQPTDSVRGGHIPFDVILDVEQH